MTLCKNCDSPLEHEYKLLELCKYCLDKWPSSELYYVYGKTEQFEDILTGGYNESD